MLCVSDNLPNKICNLNVMHLNNNPYKLPLFTVVENVGSV